MKKIQIIKMIFIAFLVFSQALDAEACSVFRVIAKDGTIISGRTMEFGHDMGYAMIIVPRNKSFVSSAPDGITGLK